MLDFVTYQNLDSKYEQLYALVLKAQRCANYKALLKAEKNLELFSARFCRELYEAGKFYRDEV